MRRQFIKFSIAAIAIVLALSYFHLDFLWLFVAVGPLVTLGLIDMFQTKHTIVRNFPLIGHFRFFLEEIRPEIRQYFFESDTDGTPVNRESRAVVYQRAKKALNTIPFGTKKNVYEPGYEWVLHSIVTSKLDHTNTRIVIGRGEKAYSASLLNISAMSFGALSPNAILALNGGAKDGNFAHNTGEGGLSPYHIEPGGDLILQMGTGYFGFRDDQGLFHDEHFKNAAILPNVKMIEIKISQGAKPGHGGFLPKEKITKEISDIRKVPFGKDVISPPSHSAFSTPLELLNFVEKLRNLSGGKPIGFKLCLGNPWEFVAICKAMIETGSYPDYISIDGGEGGTGAAPLEYSDSVGMPGIDALVFVRNCLVGFGLKDKIKLLCSGKMTTSFDMLKLLALGADAVYSARAMMMALGCIQALKCNTNTCPTGVATQDPHLAHGLVVKDKRTRVKNFHALTIHNLLSLVESMGLEKVQDLKPHHILRRLSLSEIKTYAEIYTFIKKDCLLSEETAPADFIPILRMATSSSFRPIQAKEEGSWCNALEGSSILNHYEKAG